MPSKLVGNVAAGSARNAGPAPSSGASDSPSRALGAPPGHLVPINDLIDFATSASDQRMKAIDTVTAQINERSGELARLNELRDRLMSAATEG